MISLKGHIYSVKNAFQPKYVIITDNGELFPVPNHVLGCWLKHMQKKIAKTWFIAQVSLNYLLWKKKKKNRINLISTFYSFILFSF